MAKNKTPKSSATKLNPFELKFNRQKHQVLGKRCDGGATGRPGLSKKLSLEKRRKTLAVEADNLLKKNKVVDKRIAEKELTLSSEEKATRRFAAERTRAFKENKFNLSDNIDDHDRLTHGGHALTSVQKYDRVAESDSEDEDGISADVVARAHFGGGDGVQETNETSRGSEKSSRAKLIEELIAKSRINRLTKQDAKDAVEEKVDRLDNSFSNLLSKLNTSARPVGATKTEQRQLDSYDKSMLEFKLSAEKKAQPSERTKTLEERAADEKHNLEELEKLRLARMNAQHNARSHRSIDSDIGFVPRAKKPKNSGLTVRFDETGKLIGIEKLEKPGSHAVSNSSDEEGDYDEEDENLDDLLAVDDNEEEDSSEGDEDEEPSSEEESEDDCENSQKDIECSFIKPQTSGTSFASDDAHAVPFVFEMPRNFEEFLAILTAYHPKWTPLVLERIIKCHHPSLKEGNKTRLARFMVFVLRLFEITGRQNPTKDNIDLLGQLTKLLYTLNKFDVEHGTRCVRALVRQLWKTSGGKNTTKPPSFVLIATIRLVAALYPVSDLWHPVVSPMICLASHVLSQTLISTPLILARQTMLAATLAEYASENKRLLPEVVAFARGALASAVVDARPPSNVFPSNTKLLSINEDLDSDCELQPLSLSEVFDDRTQIGSCGLLQCRVLRCVLVLVQKLSLMYSTHSSVYPVIFRPMSDLLEKIPNGLPFVLREQAASLESHLLAECSRCGPRTQMSRSKTEQAMIRMLEPRFEENFDPERPRMNRDQKRLGKKATVKKMHHQLKKERKGALKEIRKDAVFMNKRQREKEMASDAERKQKVKTIMGGLQGQQSEMMKEKNAAKMQNKKMRRQARR